MREPRNHHLPKYVVEEPNLAIVRALGRPRTVLDVGCGIGLTGAEAKAAGAHVVGVDQDERALSAASTRLDEVCLADIEREELAPLLGGRTFDLILLGDVLEHTRDPLAVLRRLVPLLGDGGRVIVSVPNVAAWTMRLELLRGRFDYEPSGILDDTHLRFFTKDSACELVRSAGLQIVDTDLNPMIVRAAKAPIRAVLLASRQGELDPTALQRSAAYRAYSRWVRPFEDAVAKLAPGALAFQHVIVARKQPASGPLSLTVGMLTRNEAGSIARMVDDIRAVAPDAGVLIVDGSDDDTPVIAQSMGVEVVRQVPARGHGPAMALLLAEAARRSEALIYLDCDRTYPVDQIPRIRRLLEDGADVVNATRTRKRPAAMPLPNFVANRVFAAVVQAADGLPTTDVHSGMRGYRCSVLRDFAFDGTGDALPVDMLVRPARAGYRVVEFPIRYDERFGDSKLQKLSGTVWTFVRAARSAVSGRRPGADSYVVQRA